MSNKRNGSPLEMGVTKRSSLDSPPVSGIESRPLTRSRLRASKSTSVLLNSPWTNEKRKRIRIDMMQKKSRPIGNQDQSENKENQSEPDDQIIVEKCEDGIEDLKNSLNLETWTEIHSKNVTIIKEKLDNLNNVIQKNSTEDNFWTIEIERVNGEGNLFLSQKSKLNQFGEMCKDPTNQKFQVKKEDDLKAYWDGMVFPSVQDFINRTDWLIESGSLEWTEAQKEKNPFKPILKVQPTNKTKPQKTKQKQEIDLKQKEKLKAAKEAADKRRAEMRKKMMEMKRKNMNSS